MRKIKETKKGFLYPYGIILSFLFLLMFSLYTSAAPMLTKNAVVYYPMNKTGDLIDIFHRYNATQTGTPALCDSQSPPGKGRCFNGDDGHYFTTPANIDFSVGDVGTICFWASITTDNNRNIMQADATYNGITIRYSENQGCGQRISATENVVGRWLCSTAKPGIDSWQQYCYTFNYNVANFYVNGSFDNLTTTWYNVTDNAVSSLTIGRHPTAGVYMFKGGISDICIFNATLAAADIAAIANVGCYAYLFNPTAQITWDSLNPHNGTYSDDNITFYYNLTTSDSIDISFYIDNFLNKTETKTINGIYNFTYATTEGSHLFKIMSSLANTTTKALLIDKTIPMGVINNPNYANTTKVYINSSFIFNISASDNNLIYSINTTCKNTFTDYVDDIFLSSYNRINITSFAAAGVKNCTTRICDAHTGAFMSAIDMSTEPLAKTLYFDGMVITSKESVKDITYKKELDRYTFCYDILEKTPSLTLYIPKECVSVPNSKYTGHFVCADRYWLDFEGYKAEIKGNSVIVDISDAKDTNICFNSIGELNCISYDYKFEILEDSTPPLILNITPINNSVATSIPVLFKSFLYDDNIFNCTFWLTGETTQQIVGVNNITNTLFSANIVDGTYYFNISCFDIYKNTNTISNNVFLLNTTLTMPISALNISVCPTTMPGVLVLFIVVILSMFFIVIGFVFKTSIYGFLGGLMMFICAWYISACEPSLGLIIGIVGLITTILFAFKGLTN